MATAYGILGFTPIVMAEVSSQAHLQQSPCFAISSSATDSHRRTGKALFNVAPSTTVGILILSDLDVDVSSVLVINVASVAEASTTDKTD